VLVDDGDRRAVALGDAIVIRAGAGRGIVASPGDIVIWGGLLLLVLEASAAWQRSRSDVKPPDPGSREAAGSAATVR
jgi:hypothetical protein